VHGRFDGIDPKRGPAGLGPNPGPNSSSSPQGQRAKTLDRVRRRMRRDGSSAPHRPAWLVQFDYAAEILVRLVAASVAIGFFFGLPILALYGYELPCTNRYLLYVPFVLGTAFSSYYFGNLVTVAGENTLSPTSSVKIAAAGGAAFALLAAWVGYRIFLPASCEPLKSYVHVLGLPRTIVDETQYDIMHKHWPYASGDRFTVAYGYEVEVAREQTIPLTMKISRLPVEGHPPTTFSCLFTVKVVMDDIGASEPGMIDRVRRNSVYEIVFDQRVDRADGEGAEGAPRDDCFLNPHDRRTVKGIDIHPNGAMLQTTQVAAAAP
jgi:hypothetical protein